MYIKPLSSLKWVQMSLFSTYSGTKASSVIEAQHSEEMADVNFLKFSFFANTSLGYYKSGHVGEGLAAAFIHTCSGRAQKIPFSLATLDPRGGETRFYRRTHWSPGCEELLVAGWLAGWLASGHHTCTWVPRACLLIMHRRRSLLTISWHEWSGEQGGVPGSPDSLACSWAICSTSNRTICTSSVLVHWGKSVWWWRKSREAYFYRKTVPLRVQRCRFGQEERNTEELGLLEKTCRGVNLQEVITAESELQQYCCKQVWMPSFNWAWHFEPVTLWTDWIVMHVSINGRCAFSRSRFRMLGFFKCSLFRQCHVVWKISM